MERRAKYLRNATLALGIPLSLWLIFSAYEFYQVQSLGVYALLVAWVFAGSYATAWLSWILLEKPRIDIED
jgi:peptidoglycan/LPS O-acetylase OafA/YrhL